jgi:hypothetical protein
MVRQRVGMLNARIYLAIVIRVRRHHVKMRLHRMKRCQVFFKKMYAYTLAYILPEGMISSSIR